MVFGVYMKKYIKTVFNETLNAVNMNVPVVHAVWNQIIFSKTYPIFVKPVQNSPLNKH